VLRKEKWDQFLAIERERYAKNREKVLARQRAKLADPAERERQRERVRASYRKRPHKAVAGCAKRRAGMMQATPSWADQAAIEAFYAEARRLTIETGVPHEVDHIDPLTHEALCGLHVPANLRVITRFENRSKANKPCQL
jgi:hypothetical protein